METPEALLTYLEDKRDAKEYPLKEVVLKRIRVVKR